MMLDKLQHYVGRAFAEAPRTKKVLELKEELLASLHDKYEDHIRQGMSAEEAYSNVIGSIGDIEELIESVKEPYPLSMPSYQERRRSALLKSIAVGLYIIGPFTLVFLIIAYEQVAGGLFSMFATIAVATGILVYNHSLQGGYTRTDDSVVEEFKEWRVKTEGQREAYKSFKSAFWSITVAIYLLISFLFAGWAYTWIIFIIAAAVENIIKGVLQWRADHEK